MMHPTMVLGGGGLIGASVVAACDASLEPPRNGVTVVPQGLPWLDAGALQRRFQSELQAFAAQVASSGEPRWRIVWAAGRAVVGTPSAEAEAEVDAFAAFLTAIEAALDPSAGRLLLVSSAGALYAGSEGPPFDESTAVAPISAYGRSKQSQEQLLGDFASRTGAACIAGRVANVYGERQDISKQQGLISHLCEAILTRRPVRVFVPLDTRRHLVWSEDAGRALVNLLDRAAVRPGEVEPRIVVSGRALSIGEIIGSVRRVVGVMPPHLLSRTSEGREHAVDLRLRTKFSAELGLRSPTPLEVGIARTWRAALAGEHRSSARHDARR